MSLGHIFLAVVILWFIAAYVPINNGRSFVRFGDTLAISNIISIILVIVAIAFVFRLFGLAL